MENPLPFVSPQILYNNYKETFGILTIITYNSRRERGQEQKAAAPHHVSKVEVAEVGYDGGGEGVIVAARLDRDGRGVARVPLAVPVVRHYVGDREALGRLEAQHAADQRLKQRVHVRRDRELALADRLEEPAGRSGV